MPSVVFTSIELFIWMEIGLGVFCCRFDGLELNARISTWHIA